ncbi:MAG TPA: tryptophanase [Kofleriaceae bacterium]|jgi:tryptophanase|nr:tryptophanase [Kofleriaceae bacterium]
MAERLELEMDGMVEPYRTKVVERIRLLSRADRERVLRDASYSVVHLASADVFIDLITDSGTSAMSDDQWGGMMRGDEAYMGSRNFYRFERTVRQIFGFQHVIPTHQGRAAEHIIMELLAGPGQLVLNNTHFDTTRAHVENRKALPVDLVGDELWDFERAHPFKGNFDLGRLEATLEHHRDRVAFIAITVLNNFACSSPISMANIREVRRLADQAGIPVYFDACRFAENAYFIKAREPGYRDRSIPEIVREMMSYGHGCWMSAKKDGLVNIGGFIAVNDEAFARRCQERLVLYEGFPTYGGLARRDLEAMAIGLEEVIEEDYLASRVSQVAYLGELFRASGIVVSQPTGGSGVFIDVASIYPHLPPEALPEVTLSCDLYREGGIRAGAAPLNVNVVNPRTGEITPRIFQFARFAIPRRVYGKSHLEYVAKVMARVKQNAAQSRGYRIVKSSEILTHFFSSFEPVA